MNSKISLSIFFSIVFLGGINSALLAPHEIHLAREFNNSILAVDFVMFMFMAVPALFLPVWGYLCDRLEKGGRKALLFASVALWSLSSIVIFYASSYPVFLLARILTGVGIIAVFPLGFSIITDFTSPRGRGKVLSVFLVTTALGIGAGVLFASALGEIIWRPQFLIVGVVGGAALALFSIFFQEPLRGGAEPEIGKVISEGGSYAYRIDKKEFLKELKVGTNRWLLIARILWRVPLGVYAFKFLPYLEMSGFGPAVKNLFILIFGSGAIFGYLLGGLIGDWAGAKKDNGRIVVVISSLSLAVLLLLSAWMVPFSAELWSSSMLLVLGLGFLGSVLIFINVPNLDAIVGEVNEPEARGTLISLLNSLSWLGFGAGILLGGIGVEAALAAYRAVLIWGTLAWILTILSLLPIYWSIKKDAAQLRETMALRAREIENTILK